MLPNREDFSQHFPMREEYLDGNQSHAVNGIGLYGKNWVSQPGLDRG